MMEHVLIIGKGISGQSAAKLLKEKGFAIFMMNTDETLPPIKFSFAVISPGVSIRLPFVQKLQETMEVIAEVELAFRYAQCKMMGVTGTNGKSSLVTYLGHMFDAPICGNIGIPASEVLPTLKKDQWAIVELSSFQLQLMKSKKLDCALLLKVTDNHLDVHLNFEEYYQAKLNIKHLLKEGGLFIFEREGHFSPMKHFNGSVAEMIRKVHETFGGNLEKADQEFLSLPHRLEFVCEKNGVTIVDDSKSTNPASTAYAVENTKGPIVLIAGGTIKNSNFSVWKNPFQGKVKAVIAYGDSAESIKKGLQSNVVVYTVHKMEEAVSVGLSLASHGDTLLLSPGCSSFDQFSGYAHRGDVFKREVLG
jgi:UDP-N-acetylmuramoylalanine--D-glutamate ligase